jgi:hypothetical protein
MAVTTTISVGRRTKKFLARKKSMEEQQGGQLTWDPFFDRFPTAAEPPRSSDGVAKELNRLVAEARPWKTPA